MKIFIGSSTKNKNKANRIANELKKFGFEVYRWWDPIVFKGGDITISRLVQMSEICDGSVFVFGADDEIIFNVGSNQKQLAAPRDNVILEYGIFVGKHGVKKTLFITSPNVKLPTDLNGVTYLGEKNYAKRVADSLKTTFRNTSHNINTGLITAHINRKLINVLLKGGDASWKSRSLYIGSKGANAWRDVESCPYYTGGRQFSKVHQLIKKLMRDKVREHFDTIVSFGPGLGGLDKKVIPSIRGGGILRYIPVDINFYLANQSAEEVSESAKHIHVPFCIIGDFETGMSLISDTVHEHTPPGRAFLMLGGTFGNLEDETPFLEGLRGCLQDNDIAILDIFTASNGYSHQADPLIPLKNQKSDAVKAFLANGVEGNYQINDIIVDIDNYIDTVELPMSEASDIDGTNTFEFCCKSSGRTLISVRRYDHDLFKQYLNDSGFIVVADGIAGNSGDIVKHSVFILKADV